jgi:hypothetical protein
MGDLVYPATVYRGAGSTEPNAPPVPPPAGGTCRVSHEPVRPSAVVPTERKLADRAAGLASAAESIAGDAERLRALMPIPDRAKAAQSFRHTARHATRAADKLDEPT